MKKKSFFEKLILKENLLEGGFSKVLQGGTSFFSASTNGGICIPLNTFGGCGAGGANNCEGKNCSTGCGVVQMPEETIAP